VSSQDEALGVFVGIILGRRIRVAWAFIMRLGMALSLAVFRGMLDRLRGGSKCGLQTSLLDVSVIQLGIVGGVFDEPYSAA
jgi:hypothetical protein